MKYKFYLPIILLFFFGCGSSGFLENEKISSLQYNKNDKNSIILFNTDYNFTENGHLFIKTHHIIKVGKNTKSLPDIFNVFDGSIEKLVSYNSRIIKPDGSQITFNKNDLHKLSLSQKGRISENFMKFTWMDNVLSPGDLIESVSQHEMILPQLGINFSIPDENLEMYNISCSIHLPANFNLNYKVINDTIVPVISTLETDKTKTYLFQWNNFKNEISESRFSKKNNIPGVLVSYPFSINSETKFNWIQFGNWYLNLIADKITPDENIKLKAFQLTQGLSTDLDKMIAIFNYCQHNVRYEQVYLDKGEFIPNKCGDILQRNYGDCKDYSTLIYSLANSVGLHPSLALCFRGRGENEFYDIPVSQFNHMIVFLSMDGRDYWFDGTNRSGIPGLPTTDLINQYALILIPDSSRLQIIKENSNNQISLEGNFSASTNDLSGELKLKLLSQYAVDFLYFDYMLGNIKMKDFINHWLKENINDLINVKELTWNKTNYDFLITAKCSIPNSVTIIDKTSYLSASKIFNRLMPPLENNLNDNKLFFYPGLSSIHCDILINNLIDPVKNEKFIIKFNYKLNPGAFTNNDKKEFLQVYKNTFNELNKVYKLNKMESL